MTTRRVVLAGLVGAGLGVAGCRAEPAGPPSPTGADASTPASTASAGSTASTTSAASGSAEPGTGGASTGTGGAGMPGVLSVDGPDIQRGPASSAAVALTFHGDGDVELTRRVMAVLAAAGATVTVFAVGRWLAATPQLGRDLVAAGHDLGNHTWSHPNLPALGLSAAVDEVARGAAAVTASVGAAGPLFRPSGTPASTATIRQAALAAGYHRCVSYDVDPQDYTDPGRDVVVRRTLSGVSPGSIVSLHLGHAGTADALPAILAGLTSRGLRAVSLTSLLAGTS